jgi:hypothetical protein
MALSLTAPLSRPGKHPRCKGYHTQHGPAGDEHGCGYNTHIDCTDCKYGPYPSRRSKDPAAKCNQQ